MNLAIVANIETIMKNDQKIQTKQRKNRFRKIDLNNIDPEKITNLVITALLDEKLNKKNVDHLIRPEDEWLIWPD